MQKKIDKINNRLDRIEKEISIATPKRTIKTVKTSRGKWVFEKNYKARYELDNDYGTVEIEYYKPFNRFELIFKSGSGREDRFYENDIFFLEEAVKKIKEMRKLINK